jgi:hypothetical protein
MGSMASRTVEVHDDYRLLIGGSLESSPHWLEVVNPATGNSFARVPQATPAQLEQAVSAAKQAFVGWATTPIEERRARLLRAADRIHDNLDNGTDSGVRSGRETSSGHVRCPCGSAAARCGSISIWLSARTFRCRAPGSPASGSSSEEKACSNIRACRSSTSASKLNP